MMHFVEEYVSTKTQLHEGPLTFKQTVHIVVVLLMNTCDHNIKQNFYLQTKQKYAQFIS